MGQLISLQSIRIKLKRGKSRDIFVNHVIKSYHVIQVIKHVGQCLYQMEQPLVNTKMNTEVMEAHQVDRCVSLLPLVVTQNRVPVECIHLLLRNSNREILNYEDKFHNLNQWDHDPLKMWVIPSSYVIMTSSYVMMTLCLGRTAIL